MVTYSTQPLNNNHTSRILIPYTPEIVTYLLSKEFRDVSFNDPDLYPQELIIVNYLDKIFSCTHIVTDLPVLSFEDFQALLLLPDYASEYEWIKTVGKVYEEIK